MSALRKIHTANLPDELRKGVKKKTVYVKLFDAAVIDSIRKKMKDRAGLTPEELQIATEAGLIDWEQRYFWTLEWEAGEREADEDERTGKTSGPFTAAAAAIKHLHSLAKRYGD